MMERNQSISMIYVISDIHGCYREYKALLNKIQFSQKDVLYVLGDIVDRGPEPIKVLKDMMARPNIYPILGNHDFMALKVLKKLNVEVTKENAENHLSDKDIMNYLYWIKDGGKITADQFRQLNRVEKENVLDYIQGFSLYEEVVCQQKRYVLVHGGIHGFTEDKSLEEYELKDFIFYRTDYTQRYFKDKNTYVVTGHTPTFLIREDKQPLVYEENGHIAIDCGCVYKEKLAAYCLDTGEIQYVNKLD